jgi:threonine dehydrogenase-like Zn-dependent dehydrogenase
MTEYFVDDADFIVKIPPGLKDVGVLLEPLTIALKGVTQAYEIQRRLHLWRPRRAAVLGAGPLGLLATLALRLRGLEVTTFGLNQRPFLNAEYVDRLGATYQVSTERSLLQVAQEDGAFDILFEATGFSPLVFDAMQATAKDGVCILASITGGKRTCEVPADKINLEFVLGNKVMVGTVNANREYFEMGVKDMALAQVAFPGWLDSFLTHPVDGLDSYEELYHNLLQPTGVIKTFMKVAHA